MWTFIFAFVNQLITLAVFFHSFTSNISHSSEFIWSKICLLILLISFLARLLSLVVGWFRNFALWSFKVIKQSAVPFTSTLSSIFASLANIIPSQFILLSVSLLDFLYALVTAFVTGDGILLCHGDTYLMFYQRKSVFFYQDTFFKSSCKSFWKSFLTLWNLIFSPNQWDHLQMLLIL